MKHHKERLKEIEEIAAQIRAVLMNEWDPIGVRDVPQAADEYDGYIGEVYKLVLAQASEDEIAEHLLQIEREQMGLEQGRKEDLLPVARSLLKIGTEG